MTTKNLVHTLQKKYLHPTRSLRIESHPYLVRVKRERPDEDVLPQLRLRLEVDAHDVQVVNVPERYGAVPHCFVAWFRSWIETGHGTRDTGYGTGTNKKKNGHALERYGSIPHRCFVACFFCSRIETGHETGSKNKKKRPRLDEDCRRQMNEQVRQSR